MSRFRRETLAPVRRDSGPRARKSLTAKNMATVGALWIEALSIAEKHGKSSKNVSTQPYRNAIIFNLGEVNGDV